MKLESFLIILIFNWVLWTFVKTVPTKKGLARLVEKGYTATQLLNDGAESSVNPQIQKHKETLKPKIKISKKGKNRDNGEGKLFNKNEYNKEYYRKNKQKLLENNSIYYQKNKEKIKNQRKVYYKNNKEKGNEYKRKWQQEKKNFQSEGTLFVNQQIGDFNNKGKLPIVCEEEGNLFNQREMEDNNGEDNQIEIEEPNKIPVDDINQIDLNKKSYLFDLNEMPEEDVDEY